MALAVLACSCCACTGSPPASGTPGATCFRGAVLGVIPWILAAGICMRLAFGNGATTGVVVNGYKVVIIGQAVSRGRDRPTYFSSVAILAGNELNAELARQRGLDA